jgi:hypothetical protein
MVWIGHVLIQRLTQRVTVLFHIFLPPPPPIRVTFSFLTLIFLPFFIFFSLESCEIQQLSLISLQSPRVTRTVYLCNQPNRDQSSVQQLLSTRPAQNCLIVDNVHISYKHISTRLTRFLFKWCNCIDKEGGSLHFHHIRDQWVVWIFFPASYYYFFLIFLSTPTPSAFIVLLDAIDASPLLYSFYTWLEDYIAYLINHPRLGW